MKKIFQWYLHMPLIWLNIGAFVLGCAAGLIVWKIGDSGYVGLASQITSGLAPSGTAEQASSLITLTPHHPQPTNPDTTEDTT